MQCTVLGASADPTQSPTLTPAAGRIFVWVQADNMPADVEQKLLAAANDLGHVVDDHGKIDPLAGLQLLTAAGFIDAKLGAELQAAEPIVAASIAGHKLTFWSLVILATELLPIFSQP
ncbi:MAG: hypothetical protein ACYCW6_08540 [Candidatus Xenobia bacterium]